MQYKTMILELLQQRKELHEQLQKARQLLPALETYARELRDSHLAWMASLLEANPSQEESQVASQALEMALKEMEDRLPPVSPEVETEALSLDQAMAFVINPTPRK